MKEFFSVDVHTQTSESSSIVERELSADLIARQEQYTAKMKEFERNAQLSPTANIVKMGCAVISIFLFAIFFANLTSVESVTQAKPAVWIILSVAVVCAGVACVLSIVNKNMAKKIAKSQDYLNLIKEGETIYDNCVNCLKIPKNAKEIDLFLYVYTTKSGEEKPVTKLFNYVNTPVKVFEENGKVMIADLQTVFALDKKWFLRYEKIKDKITFNNWNKTENINDERYKEYAVKVSGTGIFAVKNCYKVILTKNGKEFSIIIPPYDGETFIKICGLKKK